MWPLESNWEQKSGRPINKKQSGAEQNDGDTLSAWKVKPDKFNLRRVNCWKQSIIKDDYFFILVCFLFHPSVSVYKGEESNTNLVKKFEVKDANIRIKAKEEKSEEIKEANKTESEELKVTNNFSIDSKVYKAGDIEMSILPKRLLVYCWSFWYSFRLLVLIIKL